MASARRFPKCGLLLLLGTALGFHAAAQSIIFSPVADTFLSQEYPGSNFGAMGFVNAGTTENFTAHRALYRFDIASGIPAGSTITSARLVLEVIGSPSNGYDVPDVGLHRMLRAWGEGDNTASTPRNAGAAGPGEANWMHRFAGTSSTWGMPGGQAGIDYLEAASVVRPVFDIDGYVFGSTTRMVSDVQGWLDHPEEAFGWMVLVQDETTQFTARRYGSREAVPAYNVPQLQVDYRVPEPAASALLMLGGGAIVIRRRSCRA